MRKIILVLSILLLSIFVPKYIELNDLIIIDKIEIIYSDKYYIRLREILPIRDNNGIKYTYKTYNYKFNSIDEMTNFFNHKKRFYFNKVKSLYINIPSDKIRKALHIKPKIIYHYPNPGVSGAVSPVVSSSG